MKLYNDYTSKLIYIFFGVILFVLVWKIRYLLSINIQHVAQFSNTDLAFSFFNEVVSKNIKRRSGHFRSLRHLAAPY